ncbi:UV excision repair RAD23-like protein, putative [Trypanosoma cruzi marinkellei]|uniref:UV excision repair protein RAD23 n=1 Tax=Trypanosoma cruzi marinkellei TaxID=85056 RepID=K2NJ03_TRYCR|nr:UV excision repair RAD23-like protein, putative [Trypanosoma cruzi marinkellei]
MRFLSLLGTSEIKTSRRQSQRHPYLRRKQKQILLLSPLRLAMERGRAQKLNRRQLEREVRLVESLSPVKGWNHQLRKQHLRRAWLCMVLTPLSSTASSPWGLRIVNRWLLALRAAYMNPDRAVEFLCTGIPSDVMQRMNEPAINPSASSERMSSLTDRLTSHMRQDDSDSALYNALMQIPQFGEIRSIVQANPESLPTVVQQLRIHHPEVIGLIQQDLEGFLRIMGNPGQTEFTTSAGGGDNVPHDSVSIPLREEERVAIQRLVELGGGAWTEEDAIEAYRACEESEEAAAHLLFSNFFE